MLHRKNSGYMTIETALIMPFIVMGIVFIIYMGFYLYDVALIRQISYISALRASKQYDLTESEVKQYAKKQLSELKENRLLVIKNWNEKIDVNNKKIKIKISAEVVIPFQNTFLQNLGLWKIKSEAEALRIDPVEIIRNLRGSNEG